MSKWDVLNLTIAGIYLILQTLLCCRLPHYFRTGKWFK